MAKKKKSKKNRISILIVRPGGKAFNIELSPLALALPIVMALAFTVVAIVITQRYGLLYVDHRDLLVEHKQTVQELGKLRDLYRYQTWVAEDYAKVIKAEEGEADLPADQEDNAPEAPPENPMQVTEEELAARPSIKSLEDWANLFPDPDLNPEQQLGLERLQVSGGRFDFNLTNEDGNSMAQGQILMVFEVENSEGEIKFIPYPEFDVESNEPNFSEGPSYNIRSSKPVSGRINLPSGGKITGLMVVAKARSGNVVMKKQAHPE